MQHIKSYNGVKAIWLDREKLIEEVKKSSRELKKKYGFVQSIFLFGSIVRGDFTGISDIDIMVLVNRKITKENFWETYGKIFSFFSKKIPISFDLIVVDKENFCCVAEKYKVKEIK